MYLYYQTPYYRKSLNSFCTRLLSFCMNSKYLSLLQTQVYTYGQGLFYFVTTNTMQMNTGIKQLIDSTDYEGLKLMLAQDPKLANEAIPYDEINTTVAHPLHRICDGVFSNTYTDEQALVMAKIFVTYGARINGNEMITEKDTPLIAACSLYADKVALYYIEQGAELNHPGCYGGTALHWAAWCGRPGVVEKLVQAGAAINQVSIKYHSTPLIWAMNALKENTGKNIEQFVTCIDILINSGADKTIPDADGEIFFDYLNDEQSGLKDLLN
ncbi:ankyrin repeat domain-containing protein [Terrimonas rubra]|uniref:Ankyrin repeat domain-containing protein n=1 Tax=Terrimonas rubra TaxID=1035890 RepID=A0ABW6A202_9BACT